jgi:predicted phosphoribosyltransferase
MNPTLFTDRRHAGQVLAQTLWQYHHHADLLVLALPRGGVPVAFEVAKTLKAPLDVFVVRKLGLPGHEEYAMGAIASGGVCVMNPDVVHHFALDKRLVDSVVAQERVELERRERLYRRTRPPLALHHRTLIVIDDGLATGSSMRAAIKALRQHDPKRIVIGVPVASPEACRDLSREVDDIVCATTPEPFCSVGGWYDEFEQTTDDEVEHLLAEAQQFAPREERKQAADMKLHITR